jgi:hypothetical protein
MRNGLASALGALFTFVALGFAPPSKMLAETDLTNSQLSIYGLHVAHAPQMKNLPAELIPLP